MSKQHVMLSQTIMIKEKAKLGLTTYSQSSRTNDANPRSPSRYNRKKTKQMDTMKKEIFTHYSNQKKKCKIQEKAFFV
jgi:hypothetical protein